MEHKDQETVRRIVREEIARAFWMLSREADAQDMPYETAELDSRALDNIARVAREAAVRVTCQHEEVLSWGVSDRCSRCGEEIERVNPFEEKEDGRG